jgi:hypothetical protein
MEENSKTHINGLLTFYFHLSSGHKQLKTNINILNSSKYMEIKITKEHFAGIVCMIRPSKKTGNLLRTINQYHV